MRRLSYSNITATAALFLALGGTSYAVTSLPRNSVGSKQIRSGAIGRTELKRGAVRSKQIRNRSVSLADLSLKTRSSLRGQRGSTGPQGPPGPTGVPFSAAVSTTGSVRSSSGAQVGHDPGFGEYTVSFDRDLRSCYAVASPSEFSENDTPPQGGEVVTETYEKGVRVRTRNSAGQPAELPFHVIVVC